MKALCWIFAWEWINIALEYTASAWVRLPRWFLAVVVVNLVTHPVFSLGLDVFGRNPQFVLSCEVGIVCIESLLLMTIYGFSCWRLLLVASFLMNTASYATGILLQCQT